MFDSSVVNEPSGFEPLKFYCNYSSFFKYYFKPPATRVLQKVLSLGSDYFSAMF